MDAFIGEIRLLPYTFNPQGWLYCFGQEVSVGSYQALYSIIGNTFGGTAPQTFKLPDLRGLVAVGWGDNPSDTFDPAWAAKGGEVAVTLTTNNIPSHNHTLVGATSGQLQRSPNPAGNYLTGAYYSANGSTGFENAKAYSTPVAGTTTVPMHPSTVALSAGSGGAHENRQPYLAMGYFINYDGTYPVRN